MLDGSELHPSLPCIGQTLLGTVFFMSIYSLICLSVLTSQYAPFVQFAKVLLPPQLLGDGHMLLDLYTLVW